MTKSELITFEKEVATAFREKRIHAPIHLSGGNEDELIEIFKEIKPTDWVLSTWRSHYHALLKGIPRQRVMDEILAGRSMMLHFPEHRFLTSAMVGGILPIACGLAAGGERVWCFIGDMAASIGVFVDACKYVRCNQLPITFVVEDNGLSTNSPTVATWGPHYGSDYGHPYRYYSYKRTYPHYGVSNAGF